MQMAANVVDVADGVAALVSLAAPQESEAN